MYIAVDQDGSAFQYDAQPALNPRGFFTPTTGDSEYLGKVDRQFAGQCWPKGKEPWHDVPLVGTCDLKTGAGKVALSHLPWEGIMEVGKVVDFGAEKYARGNWRQPCTPEYAHKYMSAALRHIAAAAQAPEPAAAVDEESGLTHLAHAACSLLFVIDCHKKQ